MSNLWIRIAILIVVLLSNKSLAFGEMDALARFNSEYPRAVQRLEGQFGSVKGSCSLRVTLPDASKPSRISEAEFALDHQYEKVVIKRNVSEGLKATAAEFIYCIGPGTTFYLARMPGAKTYTVEGIGSTASDRSAYATIFGRFVNAHYGVFGQPLTRLMKTPGFRAMSASHIKEGDVSLVKVNFELGVQSPKSTISVVFDPHHGWNIRSSDFRAGKLPGIRIETDVVYQQSQDGQFLPRRVVSRDTSGGTSTCEFTDWTFKPTPEAEFKMTYYELPDLVSNPTASYQLLPYWLCLVGVAGLIAAGLLRWCLVKRGV